MTRGTPSPATVTWDQSGVVATITLRRSLKRNALRAEDAVLFAELVRAAGAHPETCGVIVTGEQNFSAGGDLESLAARVERSTQAEVETDIYNHFQSAVRALRDSPVPTIAAINGVAVGFGLDLALWCDVRLLGPTSRLGQGWAALGLIPGTGGAALLQRLNPGRVWQLVGATLLEPEAAERHGLGTRSTQPAVDAAALVEQWAQVGRRAMEEYVRLLRADLPEDEYLQACATAQAGLLKSEVFQSRVRSVLSR